MERYKLNFKYLFYKEPFRYGKSVTALLLNSELNQLFTSFNSRIMSKRNRYNVTGGSEVSLLEGFV